MITLEDLYNVLGAIIPLYVTMFLAYASLKWWKTFTPEQCSGINRFVATFAIPLLSFQFISQINPFKMNFLFIAADALSKSLVLFLLFFFSVFSQMGNLDWTITLFSLSTLPNTLVMGIPLLKSMYGNDQQGLMIQVVVLQSIIWYTLLLFLFEYREARNSVMVSRVAKTDVVHVVEIEQQRVLTGNRVVPDTEKGNVVEEEGEGENGEELHKFVWRCWCCNSQGN